MYKTTICQYYHIKVLPGWRITFQEHALYRALSKFQPQLGGNVLVMSTDRTRNRNIDLFNNENIHPLIIYKPKIPRGEKQND
jgi:hypothetical protein